MKKRIILFLAIILCIPVLKNVQATNFEGKEDEYTEKCKQTESLSNSDLKICKEFTDYLKDKNADIQNQINQTEKELQNTLASIESAQAQLAKTELQINSVKNEIDMLNVKIEQATLEIELKEQQLADRMYFLQSYVNGNQYLYLLLRSDSIDQLITRVQNIDELTSYDQDLIVSLAKAREQLEIDKEEANKRYDDLFILQTQQLTLLTALGDKASSYSESLDEIKDTLAGNRIDIGFIDESLSEAEKRLIAEEERKKAEEEAKKEEQQQQNQNNNSSPNENNNTSNSNPSSNENNNTSNNESSTNNNTSSSNNSSVVNGIIATAKSKVGSQYVYGGSGPTVFDCSGFAQWVYKQNGIYIPRTVTTQYYACEVLERPEPGDLVFFSTFSFRSHVGIYIGNNQFIHAGSSNTGVCYGDLSSSYWSSRYLYAGRFR